MQHLTSMTEIVTRIRVIIVATLFSLICTACASYPCGEPTTGVCSPVSQNYKDSFSDYTNADDLPRDGSSSTSSKHKNVPVAFHFSKYFQVPANNSPLVSQPTMMRVWLTPYTDNDNVYHDQSYEYILTDKGHWLYANNFKTNYNLTNVSLGQGGDNVSPHSNTTKAKTTSLNPNNLLSDFPAFNALNKHEVPMDTTTAGTTKIYAP